ncbi:MAG: hypothetical protein HY609_00300 [Deltaproteobacteria bacterium]|nr:hypothetical protein [Deltaproteobacteria bacterium]MBI4223347.1 hypothetical protein [Deltaproteobacteria bacterium]
MKTGLLTYARTNSYRLPGKVLLEVMGRPILSYQIERLKNAKKTECFILATTPLAEDDVLADLARAEGLALYRGSVEDLIERMLHGAQAHGVDFLVTVGSDNIFVDPCHVDLLIDQYEKTGADFLYCPDLPLGASPYAVKVSALETCHRNHQGKTDHGWDLYFLKNKRYRVERVPVAEELRRPELRMTMDYLEDFQFFKAVLETLYSPGCGFPLQAIIRFIDTHPAAAALAQERVNDWNNLRKTFEKNIKE